MDFRDVTERAKAMDVIEPRDLHQGRRPDALEDGEAHRHTTHRVADLAIPGLNTGQGCRGHPPDARPSIALLGDDAQPTRQLLEARTQGGNHRIAAHRTILHTSSIITAQATTSANPPPCQGPKRVLVSLSRR